MSDYHRGLIFETQEQADFYNSLPDNESRRNFFITLANKEVASILGSPDIQRGIRLLGNPSSIKQQNGKTVEKAIKAMDRVKSVLDHTTHVVAEHAPIPGSEKKVIYDRGAWVHVNPGESEKAAKPVIRSEVRERSPSLRVLETKRDGLQDRVEKRPLEFVLFMDRLPSAQRQSFMDLISYVDGSGQDPENQSRATIKLSQTIKNRRVLGVGEKPGYEPQIIHITLVDGRDLPKFDLREKKPEEGQEGREKRKDELVDETNAPYRVKAESMIDFALKYAPERWNHALAVEFRQLNRDGHYDQDFLNHYHSLNNSYPESQQRFEDPYEKAQAEKHEMMGHSRMMMEGKNEKIAYDIHLILTDIVRRRQQSNVGAR